MSMKSSQWYIDPSTEAVRKDYRTLRIVEKSLLSTNALAISEKCARRVFDGIMKLHKKDRVIKSVRINLLLTGEYTMINYAEFGPKLRAIRDELEKRGLRVVEFNSRYEQSKETAWIFDIAFRDADPTEIFENRADW